MTDTPEPNEQHLLSVRYVSSPYCCIPTTDPDRWGVFIGGKASRDFLGLMTTEELLTFLRESWEEQRIQYNKRQSAVREKLSSTDLADILSNLEL